MDGSFWQFLKVCWTVWPCTVWGSNLLYVAVTTHSDNKKLRGGLCALDFQVTSSLREVGAGNEPEAMEEPCLPNSTLVFTVLGL